MANYYTHFAMLIDNTTVAESEWLRDYFQSEDEDEDGMTCHEGIRLVLAEGNRAFLNDDGGSGNVERLAACLRAFLLAHRPDAKFIVPWSCTCDKQRTDGFDGGAVIVSARREVWFNPLSLAEAWDESEECEPHVYDYSTTIDDIKESLNDKEVPSR